jgi:multidrug efflux pump
VALYLKPVQDVTLDPRGRHQYQYSLSDVDSATVATQATRLTEALRKRPELPTSTTTCPTRAAPS